MDINDFRALTTVVIFIAFVGIAAWAYRRSNKTTLDNYAQIPFEDEENRS